MPRDFRQLKDKLEIYFFNSEKQLLKTAEDYVAQNPEQASTINSRSTPDYKISGYADWYGYDPKSSLSIAEQYSYDEVKKFSNMPLLRQAIEKFDIIKRGLDLGGDFDQARMRFSALPRGVFNFGLASKGLIRRIEYYDEEIGEVIEDRYVKQSTIDGIEKVFYYFRNEKKHFVRKQQKNTMLVKNNFANVTVEYNKEQKIFLPYRDGKIFNGEGENRLGYSTTIKKVYMYREKLGGGVSPYVDLFVNVSGLSDLTTENMLAKNLSAFIVADILEKAGVKVRIYGLRSYKTIEDSEKDKVVFVVYNVKDYGETVDFNKIASFTSDVRFYRVNLWRATAAIRKMETGQTRYGYGSSLYGGGDDLYNSFSLFKNWLFANKGTVKYDTKITDRHLMVFSGLPYVTKHTKLTGKGSEETYKLIEKEVYRTLDYVGMLLTKNPKGFIQKVYDREKSKSIFTKPAQHIRSYLEQLLKDNLVIVPQFSDQKDSYENKFSTPRQEVPKIKERTDALVNVIREIVV